MGIEGVLSQLNKSNVEQPVAYYSRSRSKAERSYAVTRKEMPALVDSLLHYRCYLLVKKFTVRTDHSALQWLQTFREPVGQVARWIEQIAEYDFDIVHRPGKQYVNADALSRYPVTVSTVSVNKQWLNTAFKNDFKKQQNKDLLTATLLEWVTKATRPKAEQMDGAGRELRYYWARFDKPSIEDGIFGILNPIEDGPNRKFCAIVSQQAKQEILELAHGSSTG